MAAESEAIDLPKIRSCIGGHIHLDEIDTTAMYKGLMFQCFLTNNHAHFVEGRVEKWRLSRTHYDDGVRRIVHASYVTFPWSTKPETREKSISDIDIASRCANILGIWGLNVHLSKEYHLSPDFDSHIERAIMACSPPCKLLFEIVGNSSPLFRLTTPHPNTGLYVLPPIERMVACQESITRVARRIGRDNGWGFCFDTAHAFVTGQPLTTEKDVQWLLDTIREKNIRIEAIHLNGSKYPFNSGRDQHAPIGSEGDLIWGRDQSGLKLLLRWILRHRIPTVLEIPGTGSVQGYEPYLAQIMAWLR